MNANKIVFASNINIGQNGAETDDEFLFRCFVDHPALAELRDIKNSACFLVGSTGIGKTAILRMLLKNEQHSANLELQEMSMNYIANSDVIQFMTSLDIDMNIFFQTLWKQIICIEYVKLIGIAETSDKLKFALQKILDVVTGDKRRQIVENFLKTNSQKFWNTADVNLIELVDNLKRDVSVELGAEVEKFNARAGYTKTLGSEKKIQLQQRAKRFVNNETITELSHVINALADYPGKKVDRVFLVIDGLDEPWVDESIKFKLIHALFEAVKYLRRLPHFKVVVALRNDLYEKMAQASTASTSQLEKYDDYILRLKWSKDQLKELADKRLNHLFKWKYSKENVFFSDIFVEKVDGKISTWNFLVERTLNRPRDVIHFINSTLRASEGKSSVSKADFLTGESDYSQSRLVSLIQEWSGTFPSTEILLDLLVRRPPYFEVSELCTSKLTDTLFSRLGGDEKYHRDKLWINLTREVNGGGSLEPDRYAAEVFHRLHLTGAVGLKLSVDSGWQWISTSSRPVPVHSITPDSRVEIHKMLWKVLKCRER
jgi:Cdc6-like AAA superfamily ATPase